MSFSWTTTGIGYKEITTVINEVQTNINTLLTSLGKSFSWTSTPLVSSTNITDEHYDELRDAADYTKDWNYCYAENSSNDGSVDTTDQSSNNSAPYNSVVYSTMYPSGYGSNHLYCSGQYQSDNPVNQTTNKSPSK